MSTTTSAPVTSQVSPLDAATTVIFAVLGVVDVALVGAIWTSSPPPLGVSLGVAGLGLITLAGLPAARRGSRIALGLIVGARLISAALAVPAFFLDAPAWAMLVEGLVIVATVAALILLRRNALRHRVV
jgi:hypothetical protein